MKRALKWIVRCLTTKHRYEKRLLALAHLLVTLEEEMVRKRVCRIELSWVVIHAQFELIEKELR